MIVMKNPFKKNKTTTKIMEKVLLNRDLSAEMYFYNGRHSMAVTAANKWIIPLMHKFEMPVSVKSIDEVFAGNVRGTFLDAIIRKKVNGVLWPSEWKRYQSEAEHVLDAALLEIIEQGERMKAFETEYNGYLSEYQNKIREIEQKLERGYNVELNQKKTALYTSIAKTEASRDRQRHEHIEDEKRDFENMVEAKLTLGMARGFVILDNDRLVYDKDAVEKRFAVYADTEQEIKLLDKVKQLAALINEVYGTQFFEPATAFYHFFSINKDNGRVVVKPDLEKETLVKYAKDI